MQFRWEHGTPRIACSSAWRGISKCSAASFQLVGCLQDLPKWPTQKTPTSSLTCVWFFLCWESSKGKCSFERGLHQMPLSTIESKSDFGKIVFRNQGQSHSKLVLFHLKNYKIQPILFLGSMKVSFLKIWFSWLVGLSHLFGFPFCQRLWALTKLRDDIVVADMEVHIVAEKKRSILSWTYRINLSAI